MPDERQPRTDARDQARRHADHVAIDRLASSLVRALAGRLEATGLTEIEVTEGGGRIRVRRPVQTAPGSGTTSAASDGQTRSGRSGASLVAVGPGSRDGGSGRDRVTKGPGPGVATAPAVGYFSPRDGIRLGAPVTAGERLGIVDVLGVGHEVTSPIDGVVGEMLIEPGQAVEYGQRLVTIDRAVQPVDPAVSET